jgi:biotin operon repressor
MYIRLLERIVSRSGPSRMLSFNTAHVLKCLQLLQQNEYASRAVLAKELGLGEDSIKTLIKHLKANNIIETRKAGCRLTGKGKKLSNNLLAALPAEVEVPMNSITIGKYNHAVLLREYAFAVTSGIEQRDEVIKFGGDGATTLLYKDNKFVMPRTNQDCLSKEPKIRDLLIKLQPRDSDVIIIGSASNKITAELGAKSAALFTIASHERHNY